MYNPRLELKDKKTSKSVIFLVLQIKNERIRISTKISIPPKFWNKKNQYVTENRELTDYKDINIALKKIKDRAGEAYEYFENQGITPTANDLKLKYIELLNNPKKLVSKSHFWECFEKFVEQKKIQLSTREAVHYNKALRKHMEETEKLFRLSINLQSFKPSGVFIQKFEEYLKLYAINSKGEKGFTPNSVGKQMKQLKVFLRWCFASEYCPPFDLSHIKSTQVDSDNIYLNDNEINSLLELKLTDEEEKVRDLFVIGCETAMRFSDFCRLSANNVDRNKGYIKVIQRKTGESVKIPINSRLADILNKYNNNPPNYKEGNVSVFNSTIKTICKKAKFNETTIIREIYGKESNDVAYEKWQLVSSHTCRRSFCTNRYLRKIDVRAIMAISGHKTEKSFLKYLKLKNDAILNLWDSELRE